MEDRAQLPPDLPIQLPPSPLGDKYNVILALPSRMRQALMAVFHTSSFGLLIKPPEEDCSRIGQTFSSHTGRTSGLPFCSVSITQKDKQWTLKAAASGITLAGTTNQVTLSLQIGDDAGNQAFFFVVT